jgi:tetratricopeptide (TPR) repeat protein
VTKGADKPAAPRRREDIAPYVLIVGAVVLAWQIALQPIIQRAPVKAAVQVAPGSPIALRRAAEAELEAGRNDNAASLGREALSRSPFDVRALRVVGLTEARAGRTDRADDLLTLAGNWSLRDDQAHAWLVEHRLRRGDYSSSFAHADTLVRRRDELRPQVFRLFTLAAREDSSRALPVLVRLLAARPPWRSAYLTGLYADDDGLPVAASLAVMLQSSEAPLTTQELAQFYEQAAHKGQEGVLKTVRARLNRPRADAAVTNGSFDDPTAPHPFQWSLIQKAGAATEILADDLDPSNFALRVEYDGSSAGSLARQRTFLAPGRYRFQAESRIESGEAARQVEWTITCAAGGTSLASVVAIPAGNTENRPWAASSFDFSITPACSSQWLELRGLPGDDDAPIVAWFDRVGIISLDPPRN